ncbi:MULTISPECIES: M20 aminoacylase family protein [Roseobacteraceae]|jgi:hippurate hydrolase|uniref:Amidohydrolase n=1 Tax=Celeribacter baekdonensis B30 TaxID=1208323 RepID=K2K1E6_9RHOB|nr:MULTISPECIES: M20 aminoacylase family protein [Roseobacteraceae]EKE71280.1 amidohydrolase [Celeribacter baekdonensis B30]KAB6716959.1 amidohydrolase [Roseobacter sp. TSBP12]
MAIENWVAREIEDLIAFRHDLHENPELLYEVHRTAAKVAEALRAAGVDEVVEGMGQTGVVGVIHGKTNISGRMIGLRADMDALPILEETGLAYASKVPGKMHACGHDGHSTMLLGAAKHLAETRAFDGTVIVIFQPAEEGGAGAQAMIEDGLFERWPCDEVYGMHNMPGLDVGKFTTAPGPIMAAVDILTITITGKGGHAAEPHTSIDPFPALAGIIQAIHGMSARSVDPFDAHVVSLCAIEGGHAHNVIPQQITVKGTVRTMNEALRDHVEHRVGEIVSNIAAGHGCVGTLDYKRSYPVLVNHAQETEFAAEAARAVAGEENVTLDMTPTLGGEDFAFMLNKVPGCMINIGNGPSANLHHPAYNFNDDVIGWGSSYWVTLVRQRLSA